MSQEVISHSGALTVSKLSAYRSGRQLSLPASFLVQAGDVICLTGVNGSGKSTLLRMIAGFLPCHSGDVTLDGAPYKPHQPECRLSARYLGSNTGLSPELTGWQNLRHLAALHRMRPMSEQSSNDLFQISDFAHRQVKYLSAGQCQRLALTALLVPSDITALWLLDEAETGLDADSQARLHTLITSFKDAGGRVILASHNPDFQQHAAQQIALLSPETEAS